MIDQDFYETDSRYGLIPHDICLADNEPSSTLQASCETHHKNSMFPHDICLPHNEESLIPGDIPLPDIDDSSSSQDLRPTDDAYDGHRISSTRTKPLFQMLDAPRIRGVTPNLTTLPAEVRLIIYSYLTQTIWLAGKPAWEKVSNGIRSMLLESMATGDLGQFAIILHRGIRPSMLRVSELIAEEYSQHTSGREILAVHTGTHIPKSLTGVKWNTKRSAKQSILERGVLNAVSMSEINLGWQAVMGHPAWHLRSWDWLGSCSVEDLRQKQSEMDWTPTKEICTALASLIRSLQRYLANDTTFSISMNLDYLDPCDCPSDKVQALYAPHHRGLLEKQEFWFDIGTFMEQVSAIDAVSDISFQKCMPLCYTMAENAAEYREYRRARSEGRWRGAEVLPKYQAGQDGILGLWELEASLHHDRTWTIGEWELGGEFEV